ncbi:MAG: tetratricopeptide repeat protein [Treponema sp.]|jgi:tetratricopeptide (TPR) repeat protein|nr:tetratricopeptide repeat protein [Treponema sp.]
MNTVVLRAEDSDKASIIRMNGSLFLGIPVGLILLFFLFSCAVFREVTSAEEYYSLGMAYFELGKYAEAEKWLNRARAVDKTKVASEYNLGRIAFETERYEEALRYFNRILTKDPENILALKAAAYTLIKTGDLAEAETFYDRVLALVPESADDGYNYALILFALEKYAEAETVLLKYPYTLDDNSDAILLLARSQNKLEKAEAVDRYAQWLQNKTDNMVRYEYAQLLEKEEFYARALEEYRTILSALPRGASSGGAQAQGPERSAIRFTIGRLLLIADPENQEGITELGQAVDEGFNDTAALESLLEREGVTDAGRDDIRKLIAGIQEAAERNDAESSGAAEESKADVEGNADQAGK